ncbi:hypothetical protein ABW19_dt0209079 [Dactylella cylindrospora]|nr:hypothetical protein ABW19_dt0209079 [Dactylella cylindrospora]
MGRPKRKEQSGSPDNENDPSKRLRQTPASPDINDASPIVAFGRDMLKRINNTKDKRGHLIAADFQMVPDKEELPSYYKVIKNPIALDVIESKLGSYKTIDEFFDDFQLMEENAHTFNKSNSLIAQYSTRIKELVKENIDDYKSRLQRGSTTNSSATAEAKDALQGLLKYLNEIPDTTGEASATYFFRSRPSKKDYPDYYKIISNPISLKDITKKLADEEYPSGSFVDGFEDDMMLMFSNAAEYNEDDSDVMKDAKILKQQFIKRMAEVRKTLGLSPRALAAKPEPGSEDVVMTNGIETAPKILLKMNGQKKAGSPASLTENSKQTTAVSSPSAMSVQTPPPGIDQTGVARTLFKKSFSPLPAAASPANAKSTSSVSPMLAAATMAQPTSAMSPPSAPKIKVHEEIKQPEYATFTLNGSLSSDGTILKPCHFDSWARKRRPGKTAADSPIQFLRISTSNKIPSVKKWEHVFKPEKHSYESGNVVPIAAYNYKVTVEAFLHPQISASKKGYGIWLSLNKSGSTPPASKERNNGLVYSWDLPLAPGKSNVVEVMCDMIVNPDDKGEQPEIERAVFWVNLVLAQV